MTIPQSRHALVLTALFVAPLSLSCANTSTGTCGPDFTASAGDFTCLTSWPEVGGARVKNVCGQQDLAEELLRNPKAGRRFPMGTIIQVQPGEAMVKRAPGFDPAFQDWEYFNLGGNPSGTNIKERGVLVRNPAGECRGCHAGGQEYDFICQQSGHGCPALSIKHGVLRALQFVDSRCLPP